MKNHDQYHREPANPMERFMSCLAGLADLRKVQTHSGSIAKKYSATVETAWKLSERTKEWKTEKRTLYEDDALCCQLWTDEYSGERIVVVLEGHKIPGYRARSYFPVQWLPLESGQEVERVVAELGLGTFLVNNVELPQAA